MTALKAHEVARFIERPDIDTGVFLAFGPDAGLVRETGQRLARRFAGSDPDSMNLLVLDGSEIDADPGRLGLEARTTSLFGDRRVVRVRGAGKSAALAIADLAADPAGAAIILEAGNLAPRDPLRALVEGARFGRALPCYPDSDEAIDRLIAETFGKAGIAIDPDAAAALRDSLGNDREVTRRELEKLVLFAASSKRLHRADILALCADNATLALDEVADAAGAGDAAALDAALARATAAAVPLQQLLGGALSHFTALRRWRVQVDAGQSASAVLDAARPKPHFSRRSALERQLRLWTDTRLGAALERLQSAVADSRKFYDVQETVALRGLLAVCMLAAEA